MFPFSQAPNAKVIYLSNWSRLKGAGQTPEHPVYVAERNGEDIGWVLAGDLLPGDIVSDIDGGPALKVVSNRLEKTGETVYNFEVAGTHSYFADELGLWVHNPKIVDSGGVKVVLYSRDHAPPHAHVIGKGPETRIGQNCKPLRGDPELSPSQAAVVSENIKRIRKAIGDAMKAFRDN